MLQTLLKDASGIYEYQILNPSSKARFFWFESPAQRFRHGAPVYFYTNHSKPGCERDYHRGGEWLNPCAGGFDPEVNKGDWWMQLSNKTIECEVSDQLNFTQDVMYQRRSEVARAAFEAKNVSIILVNSSEQCAAVLLSEANSSEIKTSRPKLYWLPFYEASRLRGDAYLFKGGWLYHLFKDE